MTDTIVQQLQQEKCSEHPRLGDNCTKHSLQKKNRKFEKTALNSRYSFVRTGLSRKQILTVETCLSNNIKNENGMLPTTTNLIIYQGQK